MYNNTSTISQKLEALRKECQERILNILEEYRRVHGLPNASFIALPEQFQDDCTAMIQLEHIHKDYPFPKMLEVNEKGFKAEGTGFLGWDDLVHENNIFEVAEKMEAIRHHLMEPRIDLLIQAIMGRNPYETHIMSPKQIGDMIQAAFEKRGLKIIDPRRG